MESNAAIQDDKNAVSEAESAIDQAQAAYDRLNETALEQIAILPELENALGYLPPVPALPECLS